MIGDRKKIAQAVLDTLVAGCDASVKIVTSSRRARVFSQVDPNEMPALFLVQKPEMQDRGPAIGLPTKRTMHFEAWLYTCVSQDPAEIPADQLNDMIDAIEDALSPSPLTGTNTLGGLVKFARIDGSVEIYENLTTDGKSIAVVPIAVLLP